MILALEALLRIYDRFNKGYQYKQILFEPARAPSESEEDEVNNMLALVKNPANKVVALKAKEKEKPRYLDRSLLEKSLGSLKNGNVDNLGTRTVFLNFFFQGCYPCVKSYPYLNELYQNKRSDVLIVGVDHLLRDTSTIEKYAEKYQLQYPILTGEKALHLKTFFKAYSDPTFIIVAADGNVIRRHVGFSRSFFKNISKILTLPH